MRTEIYATNLRFELKKNGYTLARVARNVGVSKSLVSKILKRQRKNKDVELFLASVLGVKAEHLWHLEFRDALVSTDCERKEGDRQKAS
jgi:lambda repressor-like predicted transcriptional regulator